MDVTNEIVHKVKRTITGYEMIVPGDRVVVAVSGGSDSVCLLDILHRIKDELGIQLHVAHFDHGLRPAEDEAETRFVASLAETLQLPFGTKKATPSIGGGSSLEERARLARYRFLETVKETSLSHKIAVGHNLNDQAETVLMRLLRGSGPSGLAGIPPKRDGTIIRPLIRITSNEILAYLAENHLRFVTDSTNLDTRYLRNRIRSDILPLLEEYQPRIVEILGQTADIMRREDEWMEAVTGAWVEHEVQSGERGETIIPLTPLLMLPMAQRNRVIRYALKMTRERGLRGVGVNHIEAVYNVAAGDKPQARVNLPDGLLAKRVYDRLFFVADKKEGELVALGQLLDGPGIFHIKTLGCMIHLEELDKAMLPVVKGSHRTAFLDADQLTYPLTIRTFQHGDRLVPLGMSGHKKLKDLFIDLKIPSEARAQIPILVHGKILVWVCGLRIDDRFKVTEDTQKVLKVTYQPRRGTELSCVHP